MEIQALNKTLNELHGLICSNIVAGRGVGTAVHLDFGKIVQRRTLETPRGSREICTYEASIFIEDATWRLEDENTVICSTSADSNAEDSTLVTGLQRLYQRRVIEAKLCNTGLDLILSFEGGLVLLVFSVAITSDYDAQNYSIFIEDQIFTVEFDGTVAVSARDMDNAVMRNS